MTDTDQPALWQSSDAAAKGCQRRYMFWVRTHLILLGATGLVAAWSPRGDRYDPLVSGVVALLMFGALMVGLLMRLGRMDEAWFRTRALAENAKAAAWRFAMKPRPVVAKENDEQEQALLEELQQVRGRFPQVEKYVARCADDRPEITTRMREVRTMATGARLDVYTRLRLQDQIDWYRQKAKDNAVAESRWFVLIFGIEALAIVAAVIRIFTTYEYNPTGGVAAIAAVFVAWSQTKRFSDLASAYSVAWQDLSGLCEHVQRVHDEPALQRLVADVESAISREHRLWVEKRST